MDANNWLWWRDGVIYQIYPRSFQDSNGDGIGDLPGIIQKLDYLSDLGIDAIWLSPIYPSPDVDFGYDVADYIGIDPKYGTMSDFDELVHQAHARKIRIVLDLVLNHTSDQHPWFMESRSSRNHPRRDWYMWRDPAPGGKAPAYRPPNNWASVFGGSGWEFDPTTGQYYYHMFYKEQPDLNWRNPEVRQAMLDVFRFWMEKGVDGFRLDVFNVYFKDAEFRSNPSLPNPAALVYPFIGQRHVYDNSQPEMMPVLAEVRQLLDSYPERYAVGETFLSSADKAAQYCSSDSLHAAFNFEFLQCRWNPACFMKSIQRWENCLPDASWPNYVLSNHDVKRAASRLGRGENDDRLKVAAALLLTLRGTPFIYYGEEIGMRDIRIERREDVQDPIGQRLWPFYKGRDGCRSPMQWDRSDQAGFSTSVPWLPVHANHSERNVVDQKAEPDSLFNFYRSLIRLRKQYPALQKGMFMPLTFDTRAVMGYLRQTNDQAILVALNFSNRKLPLVLGGNLANCTWHTLLSSKPGKKDGIKANLVPLEPNEAWILISE